MGVVLDSLVDVEIRIPIVRHVRGMVTKQIPSILTDDIQKRGIAECEAKSGIADIAEGGYPAFAGLFTVVLRLPMQQRDNIMPRRRELLDEPIAGERTCPGEEDSHDGRCQD